MHVKDSLQGPVCSEEGTGPGAGTCLGLHGGAETARGRCCWPPAVCTGASAERLRDEAPATGCGSLPLELRNPDLQEHGHGVRLDPRETEARQHNSPEASGQSRMRTQGPDSPADTLCCTWTLGWVFAVVGSRKPPEHSVSPTTLVRPLLMGTLQPGQGVPSARPQNKAPE